MIVFYAITLVLLSVYSYALMDPNITFLNSPLWAVFREKMVYFGYYQRALSTDVFLILIALLFLFQYFLMKNKKIDPLKIAFFIGAVLLVSYPFLSHDLFNYMFDEKVLTFYHQSPYLKKALDFPHDPWIRFMHWTHRTYPYGPSFLVVMFPASMLSFGKFLLSFIFTKATFVGLYIAAVYILRKMDRKQALFFATSPIILVEGLMNAHNDFIAVALSLIGIYYLAKKSTLLASVFFLLSAGIKYITAPIVLLLLKFNKKDLVALCGIVVAVLYLSIHMEVQPWYFLNIFALYPLFTRLIHNLTIFFFGLLISYYPYVLHGDWGNVESIPIKHIIIVAAGILNLLWLVKEYKLVTITNIKK